jgi:hypothetical protein
MPAAHSTYDRSAGSAAMASMRRCSLVLWTAFLAANATSCKSRTKESPPASPVVDSAKPAQSAQESAKAAAAGSSAAASDLRESAVDRVQFEGREGTSLEPICAAWRAELLAAVQSEHEAGNGFDNYDTKGVRCAPRKAPRLEGSLPHGWSIRSSVALEYFDGVLVLDDRYLLLRRADGTAVIGPMYSTANDMGDEAPPAASRLAMVRYGDLEVLVIASLEIGGWPDPVLPDGKPGPNAHYKIHHSGRVCRFDPTRFTCDPKPFTLYQERVVSAAERAVMLRAPKAELPVLDPATGAIVVPPDLVR